MASLQQERGRATIGRGRCWRRQRKAGLAVDGSAARLSEISGDGELGARAGGFGGAGSAQPSPLLPQAGCVL